MYPRCTQLIGGDSKSAYSNETRVWIPRSVYRLFYDQSVNYLLTLKFDLRRFQEAHTIATCLNRITLLKNCLTCSFRHYALYGIIAS